MSEEDVVKLGKDEITMLSNKYGEGVEPYIDRSVTVEEWAMLKSLMLSYRVASCVMEHHQYTSRGHIPQIGDPGFHGNGLPSPHCGCGTWIFSTEHAENPAAEQVV